MFKVKYGETAFESLSDDFKLKVMCKKLEEIHRKYWFEIPTDRGYTIPTWEYLKQTILEGMDKCIKDEVVIQSGSGRISVDKRGSDEDGIWFNITMNVE